MVREETGVWLGHSLESACPEAPGPAKHKLCGGERASGRDVPLGLDAKDSTVPADPPWRGNGEDEAVSSLQAAVPQGRLSVIPSQPWGLGRAGPTPHTTTQGLYAFGK